MCGRKWVCSNSYAEISKRTSQHSAKYFQLKWNRRVFIKLQHYIVTKQPCCFVERGTPPRHSFRESRDRYKVLHCNAYFNVYAFDGNVNDCFLIFCLSCNRQIPRHKSWKRLCFCPIINKYFSGKRLIKMFEILSAFCSLFVHDLKCQIAWWKIRFEFTYSSPKSKHSTCKKRVRSEKLIELDSKW